jgi:hypothetical protein
MSPDHRALVLEHIQSLLNRLMDRIGPPVRRAAFLATLGGKD